MQDKLIEFRCTIINLIREKNTWRQYSFSTDEDVPTTTIISNPGTFTTKLRKRFGKMSTFDVTLRRGVDYIVKASTKQNLWNGQMFTNLEAKEIYPVLDEQGQKDFLAAIVSPLRYKAITKVYPKFVDMVINNEPIDVSRIVGIGDKTFLQIKKKILDDYWKADIMSWLKPLGITEKMIQKLLGKYKSTEVLKYKIKENPYILTEIHGLGFFRVDDMVMKMFPDKKKSLERTKAFVEYILTYNAYKDGDTVMFFEELTNEVEKQIPECLGIFLEYAKIENNELYFIGTSLVGLRHFYNIERSIYERLKYLDKQESSIWITNPNYVKDAEKLLGFKLSEEQDAIIPAMEEHNFVIISGYAGVGKTTAIRIILCAYDEVSIGLCSLSAKAARRISEVTGGDAFTAHRLLGFDGKRFKYNANNPLPYRIIIFDEASMPDANLLKAVIDAMEPGCKLIFVGDNGQLPSIGIGNVFNDLLESDFKVCQLTHIYRQAQMSGIITDANLIRQGINPFKR